MRRFRFDAVPTAALLRGTATLAGAVPDGAGSLVVLGRFARLRGLLEELPRVEEEPDFFGIRYLLMLMNIRERART